MTITLRQVWGYLGTVSASSVLLPLWLEFPVNTQAIVGLVTAALVLTGAAVANRLGKGGEGNG